jgi:hypothetical protein
MDIKTALMVGTRAETRMVGIKILDSQYQTTKYLGNSRAFSDIPDMF